MFSESRAHKRIPCDAIGFLTIGDDRKALQSINVSRTGACLRVGLDVWSLVEDSHQIEGRLNVGGEDLDFLGRICWSSGETLEVEGPEGAEARETVIFGIEFVDVDQLIINGILESVSILVEPPPDESFNL